MKLVTYSPLPSGSPRAGILLPDQRIAEATGFATMLDIIRGGAAALEKLRAIAAKPTATVALGEARLHAPIPRRAASRPGSR